MPKVRYAEQKLLFLSINKYSKSIKWKQYNDK